MPAVVRGSSDCETSLRERLAAGAVTCGFGCPNVAALYIYKVNVVGPGERIRPDPVALPSAETLRRD